MLRRVLWSGLVTILAAGMVLSAATLPVKLVAFPGAEGFGKYAWGGRGGDIYRVTSLDDSGPGSLREGIETAQGPRTIVFEVSGTIQLKNRLLMLRKANLTIAGQTAPGKGITLRDYGLRIDKCRDVVVRYLRIRLGDENKPIGGQDVMTVNDNRNLILDHLSLSWGIDGNSDYRRNGDMTLQWLIYSEALNKSIHEKGEHAMCTSLRQCAGDTTVHHNIYATSRHRHPTLGGGSGTSNPEALVDFRNCVNYNWSGPTNFGGMKINVVNNYYRKGPLSDRHAHPMQMKDSKLAEARGFMSGNVFDGLLEVFTIDNYSAVWYENTGRYASMPREQWEAQEEFLVGEYHVPTQSARDAYEACLKYSGCSLVRDSVDERLIRDIIDRKGKLLDSQSDVGGWDPYPEERRPQNWDRDGDGMPDAWEVSQGLNPADPTDGRKDKNGDGYTNLEDYLNSLTPIAK
ncbi:MAG: pectate lyase [Acidobacteria bacterium]|nr:pectate lyase [Acidobacteriota bacterium]